MWSFSGHVWFNGCDCSLDVVVEWKWLLNGCDCSVDVVVHWM